MRAIFFVHLAAIITSALVVHNNMILSDPLLERLIALPLLFTMIAFPFVMVIAAIASTRKRMFLCGLAVVGDFALSALQFFVWLPTVQ